jgi:O-antigen/teichoic acid export membrane protein
VIAVVSTVFAIVIAPLVNIALGNRYGPSVPLIQILALSVLPRALGSAGGTYLVATNRPRFSLYGNIPILAVAVLAYVIVVPRIGSAGAAWTSVAVELMSGIYYTSSCLYVRHQELRATPVSV